jgi:hypothetical protein
MSAPTSCMANERLQPKKKSRKADSIKFQIPAAYFDQRTDPVDGDHAKCWPRLCCQEKKSHRIVFVTNGNRSELTNPSTARLCFSPCRSISRHFTPTRTDSRTLTPVLCLADCLKREFSSCGAQGFPSHSASAHSSAPLFFKKLSPILFYKKRATF